MDEIKEAFMELISGETKKATHINEAKSVIRTILLKALVPTILFLRPRQNKPANNNYLCFDGLFEHSTSMFAMAECGIILDSSHLNETEPTKVANSNLH